MLSEKTGIFLLNYSRKVLESFVRGENFYLPQQYPEELKQKRGVFVTLYKGEELRGCIGLIEPDRNLIEAVMEVTPSAARDPRFMPVEESELEKIKIELSILSKPELIEVEYPEELMNKIEIGRDGLIIKAGYRSGLLLPQVPVKYNWGVKEYLENLCLKAGLSIDSWSDRNVEIYKFRTKVFKEM